MGVLSAEELFISPIASGVLLVVVVIFLEYGSRFFNRMQELPLLDCKVLEHFGGELFDVSVRKEMLESSLGLDGMRSLYMLSADSNPNLQSRAAASLAALLHLAVTAVEGQPIEQVRALAIIAAKYTPDARSHAALGIAAVALNEQQCPLLLECGALRSVLQLCVHEEADAQGSAALALALMARSRQVRAVLLQEDIGGLGAIYALLRSTNPDAVRCAACTLALLALDASDDGGGKPRQGDTDAIPPKISRVVTPRVIAMLCRSRDAFLQTAGSQLLGSLAAADPVVRLRLLHVNSAKPLLNIVQTSKSASARFEAMHALATLALKSDEALSTLERERTSRMLLHALATFASGLQRTNRLQDVNVSLNGKPVAEMLQYYQARPELARYTIDVALDRMEYLVKTAEGLQMGTPKDIRAHFEALGVDEQSSMLWRLANQSLLTNIVAERYANHDLATSLRATSARFSVDFEQQLLRVTASVGVFVLAPLSLQPPLPQPQSPSLQSLSSPMRNPLPSPPLLHPLEGNCAERVRTAAASATEDEALENAPALAAPIAVTKADAAGARNDSTGGVAEGARLGKRGNGLQLVRFLVHCEVKLPGSVRATSEAAASECSNGATVSAEQPRSRAPSDTDSANWHPCTTTCTCTCTCPVLATASPLITPAPASVATTPVSAVASHCRYLVRAAKRQPLIQRVDLMAIARTLAVRYEHAHEEEKPLCLRRKSAMQRMDENAAAGRKDIAPTHTVAGAAAPAVTGAGAPDSKVWAIEPPPPLSLVTAESAMALSRRPFSDDASSEGTATSIQCDAHDSKNCDTHMSMSLAVPLSRLHVPYKTVPTLAPHGGGVRDYTPVLGPLTSCEDASSAKHVESTSISSTQQQQTRCHQHPDSKASNGRSAEETAFDAARLSRVAVSADDHCGDGKEHNVAPCARCAKVRDVLTCSNPWQRLRTLRDDVTQAGAGRQAKSGHSQIDFEAMYETPIEIEGSSVVECSLPGSQFISQTTSQAASRPESRANSFRTEDSDDAYAYWKSHHVASTTSADTNGRCKSGASCCTFVKQNDPALPSGRRCSRVPGEGGVAVAEVRKGRSQVSLEALLSEAYHALMQSGYDESLGKLTSQALDELRSSNRKLVRLELFVLYVALAAAKLPRYAAALDMHAALAGRPGAADAADVPVLRLAITALRVELKALGMVKLEATDMARRLDDNMPTTR